MNVLAYDEDTDALLEKVRQCIERLEKALGETQQDEQDEVSEADTK